MKRRTKILILVAVGYVVAMYFGSCNSAVLAPAHTAAERAQADALHFPIRVGVERYPLPAYSDRLIGILRSTGLFDSVDALDKLGAPPDLIARVTGPSEGAAVIPALTLITLGIIPTFADETWGEKFELASPRNPARSIAIETRWTGATALGLACSLLNLSPGRTSGDVTSHPRSVEHFRVSIAAHAAEIEALAAPRTAP
ncbi:MAG TPA: hypothetical protein VMH82_09900 [Myxococcota bacterium]|nr:hypothetical protein [Myxococcota bacterium]